MNPPLPSSKWNRLGLVPRCACLLLGVAAAHAQDSLRNSLAGEAAAEASRLQFESQVYNYKAGDFKLLAIPSVGVAYNDNVNLSRNNAQQDVILIPYLNLNSSYLISHQNQLNLAAGLGYSEYLEHGQYSRVRVDGNSVLSMDVYLKDFSFDFHDRYSVIDDPGEETAVANTAYYGLFMNTAGLTTTWDLRDVILTLGFDHQNSVATSGKFSYLDNAAELPLARAGFRLNPLLTVGVEGGASFTAYDQHVLNNNSSYSAGVYGDWTPGKSIHVEPRVGYTIYDFQHTSLSAQTFDGYLIGYSPSLVTENLNTWYADLSITHAVTKAISYGVSAGHEIRLGIESDAIEDSYFRPNANWAISKRWNLNSSLSYEHGMQGAGNVSGNLNETYDMYSGSLILTYLLARKLQLSLNYQYRLRSSSISDLTYVENAVGIKLSYQP
jgi:hypothetical protein